MSRKIAIAALTLGCAIAISNRVAFAASDPSENTDANSFPITQTWSVEKLLALSKDEVIALWKTLEPPEFRELDGHYMGLVPNAGDAASQEATGNAMYNEDSEIGYWLGKAYKPLGATTGEGYNRWRKPGGKVVLNMRFGTGMGKSLIDGKPSYMMYYGAFNESSSLIDELRKLDDYIYVGMGTVETDDGQRSAPGHFVLTGPTDNWVGVDAFPEGEGATGKRGEDIIDTTKKVTFASVEWVGLARTVLEELVAEHGEAGKSFSACEVFTDAPEGLAGPEATTAAWHFRIVGKTVTVGEGEIDGADFNVRAAYAQVLPLAKLVYTPEMVARMRASQPQAEAGGNGQPTPPAYLVERHNRLAVLTK